ncbi:MAG: 60S ribosomal protein L22 [Candidatus Helarchaeota archaeon]|nr:60S ribosomal protein L22 [Candidatus Helarchaeota archaeon]
MAEDSERDVSVSYVIDADHLTWVEDRLVDELGTFVEERLPAGSVVDRSGKNVLIGFTENRINKRQLKTFLKKFLHKFEIKEKFRVISTADEEFKIQKRKGLDFREL